MTGFCSISDNDLKNFTWSIMRLVPYPSIGVDYTYDILNLETKLEYGTSTFGYRNTTSMSIIHSDYRIEYKRTWPDWKETDPDLRLQGIIDIEFTGNADTFFEHLAFITLMAN